eukprot:747574-Hanusia_phi.AAC.8
MSHLNTSPSISPGHGHIGHAKKRGVETSEDADARRLSKEASRYLQFMLSSASCRVPRYS